MKQIIAAIPKRRLGIGLSIYFNDSGKKVTESYNLHPWVNNEFVKAHSLLD